jgi:tetratricopeptide (TPR) repeat protein
MSLGPQPTPDGWRSLSDLLLQGGKISAAMNLLELALPGDHRSPEFQGNDAGRKWFERGLEFADAFLFQEAVGSLQKALDLGFDNFETHYCLAGVHKSLRKLTSAELHCRKAIEGNPRFAPCWILMAAIHKDAGRLPESVTAAKRALLLDADCAPAYYDLACYYSLQGESDKALASFEVALNKGFNDYEWAEDDPDLVALRERPEFLLLVKTHRHKYP